MPISDKRFTGRTNESISKIFGGLFVIFQIEIFTIYFLEKCEWGKISNSGYSVR